MRVLLQNFQNGSYLGHGGAWTQKPEMAMAFADETKAMEYLCRHALTHTDVVVRPGAVSPLEPLTIVEAEIEVGSGDSLFIRGEGEGLSWNKGQPLSRFDASRWIWSSHQPGEKVICKLLLNDNVWAKGDDVVVRAGTRVELAPVFS